MKGKSPSLQRKRNKPKSTSVHTKVPWAFNVLLTN
jgi:hypothetical protein